MSVPVALGHEIGFHDAECGSYEADLGAWRQLTADARGPVAELGAGTGRVALALASAGRRVLAVDRDPELLEVLARRARERDLRVETLCAPVEELRAEEPLAAVIAPMQLLQLLPAPARAATLAAAARCLAPGGVLGAALLLGDEDLRSGSPEPVPDVCEVDGWTHSSLPLTVDVAGRSLTIRRLRQLLSPDGELREEISATRLFRLPPARFEAEAEAAGLLPLQRIALPATDDHVGSEIVVVEARA
jgi:SAM-dependent methyltransferase